MNRNIVTMPIIRGFGVLGDRNIGFCRYGLKMAKTAGIVDLLRRYGLIAGGR
jgi:hypothetical protein